MGPAPPPLPDLGKFLTLSNGTNTWTAQGPSPYYTFTLPAPQDGTLASPPATAFPAGTWMLATHGSADLPASTFSFSLPAPVQLSLGAPVSVVRSQPQTIAWNGAGFDGGAIAVVSISNSSQYVSCLVPAQAGTVTIPASFLVPFAAGSLGTLQITVTPGPAEFRERYSRPRAGLPWLSPQATPPSMFGPSIFSRPELYCFILPFVRFPVGFAPFYLHFLKKQVRTLFMRVLTGILIAGATLAGTMLAGNPPKGKAPVVITPKNGVKTPGVLIPFANLKAEAELPAPDKPVWMYFSQSLYVPAKDHIEKIDVRSNKPGDPVTGIAKPCGGMASAFNSLSGVDSPLVQCCGSIQNVQIDGDDTLWRLRAEGEHRSQRRQRLDSERRENYAFEDRSGPEYGGGRVSALCGLRQSDIRRDGLVADVPGGE